MDSTKEQLLQYFRTLDISVLEKLKKYSQLLIIPDEDLLVSATMSQMVEKAHSLADSLFPEWTDRSKSDFGEFLVELFALFSEKDFWYINAFANEGILRKTRSYSNAFSKASSMGYWPITCKGAICNFKITFSQGEKTHYEKGDLIIDVDGMSFTNDEEFDISEAVEDITQVLTLHEGTHVAEDITYNGYNVFIRKENIDIDSITVTIDNIIYSRVKNFGNSSSDSAHFMVLPEEDGSCSIYFGSNGFGMQPALGKSIRVEYRICHGSDGNKQLIASPQINSCLSDRPATTVEMLTDATQGTYSDTLTSIKEKAPLYFSTKRAAINETIAQKIIDSFSFVHKSKVIVIGREVIYRIIPTSGYLEPTPTELNYIREQFHPYIMAGYIGSYANNIYKDLILTANPFATKIILDVIILSGYNSNTIESSIRQIMDDVTNPLINADYGSTFSKTDVDILMRSKIPGVQSVTFKILVGNSEQIMPDVTLDETEIFRKINQDNLIVRTNVV